MWMAEQAPLACSHVATLVSNQVTTVVKLQMVPSQSLPPAIFPAHVPSLVHNPQDQQVNNIFFV